MKYCHDEMHDLPCPEVCKVCLDECDPDTMLTIEEAKARGIAFPDEDYETVSE